MHQRLGAVAALAKAQRVDDFAHLAAQQGHLARRSTEGCGRVEPEEARFGYHAALAVKALHRNQIAVHPAVYTHNCTGARDQQGFRAGQQRLEGAWRVGGATHARPHRVIRIGEQTKAAIAGYLHRRIVQIAFKPIMAGAQKGEIVGRQPFEESHGFGGAVRGQRRRIVRKGADAFAQQGQHRLPIGHRGAHIGQHLGQAGLQRGARLMANLLDLHVDHGFAGMAGQGGAILAQSNHFQQRAVSTAAHIDDRVQQPVNVHAGSGDGGSSRIYQKGPILTDDGQAQAAGAIISQRIDVDHRLIGPTTGGSTGHKAGHGRPCRLVQPFDFAGQGARKQASRQRLCQWSVCSGRSSAGLGRFRHFDRSRDIFPAAYAPRCRERKV